MTLPWAMRFVLGQSLKVANTKDWKYSSKFSQTLDTAKL